ncbi:hypothetical protein CORC01_03119 [Colletotrichum orchidophilum]|uniref:Uncharacterized protein n=1 Tax=Colletotrichum orchidophilum TaxID=1209926 RepID=A0A1G4BJL1_9PEZI|nr:uncharacterized protein CORC01_03119 [Colletotrichum orchidophilum]OHF01629.1 hypothetical protein CORC01_03119 [Colletotrichum orchidophilum]
MIFIHLESRMSDMDAIWQIYQGDKIVTRYSEVQRQAESSRLKSTREGTFAMIPYDSTLDITLHWNLTDIPKTTPLTAGSN